MVKPTTWLYSLFLPLLNYGRESLFQRSHPILHLYLPLLHLRSTSLCKCFRFLQIRELGRCYGLCINFIMIKGLIHQRVRLGLVCSRLLHYLPSLFKHKPLTFRYRLFPSRLPCFDVHLLVRSMYHLNRSRYRILWVLSYENYHLLLPRQRLKLRWRYQLQGTYHPSLPGLSYTVPF